MKLLFVYNTLHVDHWKDGLYMALKELEKDFDITYRNLEFDKRKDGKFDFTLGWGAFNSGAADYLDTVDGPKGLCIGGNTNYPKTDDYDVLFYETDWIRDFLKLDKLEKPKLIKAFGVNDEMFTPYSAPIVWDYIGVGSFSTWKRWEMMVEKKGRRLVVGQFQSGNVQESVHIAIYLAKNGVMISNQVLPERLADIYNQSEVVYIPANIYGGGERCVLEARSCGAKVEIEGDNPKLKELLTGPIPTYKDYAKQLKKGILKFA